MSTCTAHVISIIQTCLSDQTDATINQVSPPRASGVSHERKLASYAVEAELYKQHAPVLLAPPTSLAIPPPVFVASQGVAGSSFTLLLLDVAHVDEGGYTVSPGGDLSISRLKVRLV